MRRPNRSGGSSPPTRSLPLSQICSIRRKRNQEGLEATMKIDKNDTAVVFTDPNGIRS